MDIQKTKAKCKALWYSFSTKEHPECCRFFSLSFPSPGRRGSSLATHYSNTCTDFVSCCWDSTMSKPSRPCSCFILAVPSLPNILALGFSSTLTFCSVWKSLIVSEKTFPWLEQTILCQTISPWWCWQSHHTCTAKWNRWHWECWGTKAPFLASVGVLDWALKAEGSLLSPQVSLWFRVEFLFLRHRRPGNSLVHTAWSCFLVFIAINSPCEQNINMCVRTSLNPANPLV